MPQACKRKDAGPSVALGLGAKVKGCDLDVSFFLKVRGWMTIELSVSKVFDFHLFYLLAMTITICCSMFSDCAVTTYSCPPSKQQSHCLSVLSCDLFRVLLIISEG